MGWTFTHKPKGMPVKAFFEKQWRDIDILECYVKNGAAYMACRFKDLSKDPRTWAAVCLIRYDRNSHEFNFGDKDMDETMGPCYYDAPAKVLDMLTPIPKGQEDSYAAKWRAKCREELKRKASMVKLREGMIIRTGVLLDCGRELPKDTFHVCDARKGLFSVPGSVVPRYRISRSTLERVGYEVL